MQKPDKLLETWRGEEGETYEYQYFESHENFDKERTLMLVVSDSPHSPNGEPFYAATSFAEGFGKGLGPELIERTKEQLVRAYDWSVNGSSHI